MRCILVAVCVCVTWVNYMGSILIVGVFDMGGLYGVYSCRCVCDVGELYGLYSYRRCVRHGWIIWGVFL